MESKNVIDRTPCNLCNHFDVCSYKLAHEENIKSVAGYTDTIVSVDLVYVKCTKFLQKPNNTFRNGSITHTLVEE